MYLIRNDRKAQSSISSFASASRYIRSWS